MSRKSSWSRIHNTFALVAVVGATAAVFNYAGCTSGTSSTTSYATTDPYVTYSYYPADVSVAGAYWADSWAYTGLYSATYPFPATTGGTSTGAAGTQGTTTTTTGAVTTVGDAIRALARGETVCPGQVTVTQKTSAPACTGAAANPRGGVTIVFTACQTPGGGKIDGTIDVSSTRSASDAICSSGTTITLSHTTTITNLSYTAPSGAKAVIPSQTDTGTNLYTFGQMPALITVSTMGQLQTYNASGTLTSDHNFNGMPRISFAGSQSGYTVDGVFNATDNKTAGRGLTLTLMGLERVNTCCRPIGGTIQVVQTSGSTATHTWSFGPSCGNVTVDGSGDDLSLPACL
jgi:hypothetical protein